MAKPIARAGCTEAEIKFCSEFAKSGDSAQAVALAWPNQKNPGRYAHRVLKRPCVQAELERLRNRLRAKYDLSTERILKELADIALAPGLERFIKVDEEGKPFWDFSDATEKDLRLIAALDVREFKEGRGPNARIVQQFKIARDEKMKAIELLLKAQGAFAADAPHLTVNVKNEITVIERLQAARNWKKPDAIDVEPN